MGDHTAFFYGTLMAREVLNRVCYGTSQLKDNPALSLLADKLMIHPAILHDYCRHRVVNCDYPGMIPQAGHSVRGTYVTGLTEGDIFRLDRFEGPEYTRLPVAVLLLKEDGSPIGQEVETQTYVYTLGDDQLENREWDFDEFLREKIHLWADTSTEYDGIDYSDSDTFEEDKVNGVAKVDPTGGRGIKLVEKKD